MAVITVYKGNTPMQINDFDLSAYQNMGWSTTPPAGSGAPATTSSASSSNSNQQTSSSDQPGLIKYFKIGSNAFDANTGRLLGSKELWYSPNEEVQPPMSADQVNNLYQKYFGRPANNNKYSEGGFNGFTEMSYWMTRPPQELEQQLATDYKNASGIDYDGSPIPEKVDGKPNTKTQNQLANNQQQNQQQQQQAPKYQIINLDAMAKYKPEQYYRDANGNVYLNSGVTPIAGTVKDVTGTTGTTNQNNAQSDASQNNNQQQNQQQAPQINDLDKKWVTDLYMKYFDRTPTSAELANWYKETPAALEQFLQKEQKAYGYTSLEQKAQNDARLKGALDLIDKSNLPPEIKSLWKNVVAQYPNATDFNVPDIINTFNDVKSKTIDPYYKELTDTAINDLRTSFGQIQQQRASELEQEKANAGLNIRQAKAGLEKAGMTFTGKGVENLGAQSAYAQIPSQSVSTPTQIPFAGLDNTYFEGNIPQANRLIATSSAQRYAAQQQALGSKAEQQLGSGAVLTAMPGLQYTPSGITGITGGLEQQQQTKEASTLQGIVNNWLQKQQNKTNI